MDSDVCEVAINRNNLYLSPEITGIYANTNMSCIRMMKLPEVSSATGLKSTSIYALAKTGLMTPPVKLTPRSSAWPEHEIDAINRARIAGKSDDQIRALVAHLIAERSDFTPPAPQ